MREGGGTRREDEGVRGTNPPCGDGAPGVFEGLGYCLSVNPPDASGILYEKVLEKQRFPFPVGMEEARGVDCLSWTQAGQVGSDCGPAVGDADSPEGPVLELLTRPRETDAAKTSRHKSSGLERCKCIVSRFSRSEAQQARLVPLFWVPGVRNQGVG